MNEEIRKWADVFTDDHPSCKGLARHSTVAHTTRVIECCHLPFDLLTATGLEVL